MSFELALRLTDILLALALCQRAVEHLRGPNSAVFIAQIALALPLALGIAPGLCLVGLFALAWAQLWMFQGPYNGGADKMLILCMACAGLAHVLPAPLGTVALAYLAVQLVLSYAVSGWVKLRSREWRAGRALQQVFAISAYPQTQQVRALARNPGLCRAGSRAIIGFEVAFPLALLHPALLALALILAAFFHVANGLLFGLNRFVWAWLCAFPALIWFQGQIF